MIFDEENELIIKNCIACTITYCLKNSFLKCDSTIPQEPDFVAEFHEELPKAISSAISKFAPSYDCAVSSVFVHQKPKAIFSKKESCELGDLLIIYIEKNKSSVMKCNSLLLQVKKAKNQIHRVPENEKLQLELYEKWPDFELRAAGRYKKGIRILPKTLNPGAQYLLIIDPFKYEDEVGCAYPDKQLRLQKSFSDQLIDVMKFFSGRTFQYPFDGKCEDGWTDLIWRLIEISGVSKFNRGNSHRHSAPRRVVEGDISLIESFQTEMEKCIKSIEQCQDASSDSSNGGNEKLDISDDQENGGFYCMMIYAREKDNNGEL